MEPYNIKCLTFPNGSKQIRLYYKAVESSSISPPPVERNPFNNISVHTIKGDLDEHFSHSAEVSLKRTKQKVYQYARSNDWDWFVTFTFSPDKVDRFSYDACVKLLSKWLNNVRRDAPDVRYIIVPEQHKSGAWHFHGLFAGLDDRLIGWTGKYVVKRKGKQFVRTKDKIYRFNKYKFGWMTATRVSDQQRVVSYMVKYLTKDMMQGMFGRKRYWASRNLDLPEVETLLVDEFDKMVLAFELESNASFKKSMGFVYGDQIQRLDLFEL